MPRLVPIKRKKFEKFLKYVGCSFKRQKGDHIIWDRLGLERPIVFPADREIPIFVIRNNLRVLKMVPDEFLKIIEKM